MRAIERVVVPLDAAAESAIAVETAARLAARVRAPLHGIFVEDEDLLNLAALPFTRQTTLGAQPEALTPEHVELHLRVAAERVRRELLAAAKRYGVQCSFEVMRGASRLALSTASNRDLVVAGVATRAVGRHFRMACGWWTSVGARRGPLLLARYAWAMAGSVVILLRDRSEAAAQLLNASALIAEASDLGLTVIAPPAVAASDFEQWIAERLAGHAVRLQIEALPAQPGALHRRIGELDCRLLAIEPAFVEGGAERFRELVDSLACDVLIAC